MSEPVSQMEHIYREVLLAEERISPFVHHTPVLTSDTINQMVGRQVYFKCENLQKTGSFKARGAFNSVLKAKELNPNLQGVVARSSGNHGQAIALASTTAGLQSTVVVKEGTPRVKCNAIQGYGAKLVFSKPTPADSIATTERVAKETGHLFICPFASNDVLAGQGTVGMELVQDVPDLDAIIVPICGGSLATGVSAVAAHRSPHTKIYAAEVMGRGLDQCLKNGKLTWQIPPVYVPSIAEAIMQKYLAPQNFPILKETLEEVFEVNDEEIIHAMQVVFQRMKLVVEPAAVTPLAALLSDRVCHLGPEIRKVGVVFTGGNVDLDNLPWEH